jgi:2'-5' RNA ligase
LARIRTFVALDLDAPVRRAAREIIERLARGHSSVRWVAPENLHLTFKFLGDVPETELYQVCRAVTRAVDGQTAFRVDCGGVGAFPSVARPRTIWLGLDDPDGRLVQLHGRMEEELGELGFPRELRPFVPHITLGRVAQGSRRLETLLDRLQAEANADAGSVTVQECRIYASELGPDGPVYTVLGRAPLGAPLA